MAALLAAAAEDEEATLEAVLEAAFPVEAEPDLSRNFFLLVYFSMSFLRCWKGRMPHQKTLPLSVLTAVKRTQVCSDRILSCPPVQNFRS